MFTKTLTTAFVLAAMTAPVWAEEFRVEMLNKGDDGAMVYQPSFIKALPGDTIVFVSVDKGHNVETIKGLWPADVELVKTKMSEDFTLTVTTEGIYGVKCTPHFGMGMVALIQVGAPVNLAEVQAYVFKGKAKERMEPVVAALTE